MVTGGFLTQINIPCDNACRQALHEHGASTNDTAVANFQIETGNLREIDNAVDHPA